MNININTAAICLLLLLIVGCTPSVRYTRGRPDRPAGQADDRPSGRPQKNVDGSDSLRSGWEAVDGGADKRGADWLAAALREAGQEQPERREAPGGAKAGGQWRLERVVNSYLGVPYKYGGTTRSGFDCSGFASAVYREVYGMPLKRTSGAMWKEGAPVALSAARPGDLVFFKNGAFGAINHVGVYMGGGRFAHASTASGVVYSSLDEAYYAKRFAGARRML